MNAVRAAAYAWLAAGASVVPVATDGTKRPALTSWATYQKHPATGPEIDAWFDHSDAGLGLITGDVSGHLEMLELEGRAVTEGIGGKLAALAADELGDVWHRLGAGYLEATPSGGLHWIFRVDGPARRNTKLARRQSTPEELAANPKARIQVLIETRGEGGFVVVAPTGGNCHPTGRAWTQVAGGPGTIPTLTVDERDRLYAVCTLLDAVPATDAQPAAPRPAAGQLGGTTPGVRPGDDYNQRTHWPDILEAHDWKLAHRLGQGAAWVRPGKNPRDGISATTGQAADGVDRLYVFSTSTEFEPETPYTKFGAYALLEHGGDHAAAAAQLRRDGYGTEPTIPAPALTPLRLISGGLDTDGTAALAPPAPDPAGHSPRFTENGNAIALVAAHGDRIRYDVDRARWLLWTGTRWQPEPGNGGAIRELVKDVAHRLPAEALGASRNAVDGWQKKSLSAAGVTNALVQASTDPRLAVRTDQLDADRYAINTPGGLVDLRTGTIRPATPADLVTRTTNIAPDPAGQEPDPLWTAFLDSTFGGDQALAGYVQRIAGLALIGDIREQILPFWHGVGANGKSTLLEALQWVMRVGDDGYSISAPSEMLMIRKHEPHSTELAVLAGVRFVVCSELEDGQRLAEARVKLLTGRDAISARFLYQQPFTFTPSHTIVLAGNHRPAATVGGPALWRRLRCVPFSHVVPEHRRDPELPDRLKAAGGSVLAWAVAGAVDYLRSGMRQPDPVTVATAAYEADQDTVGRFVADRLYLTAAGRVPVGEVRTAYEQFCHAGGDAPVSPRRFAEELARFGVRSEKGTAGRRFYRGCALLADESEESEDNEEVTGPWYDR